MRLTPSIFPSDRCSILQSQAVQQHLQPAAASTSPVPDSCVACSKQYGKGKETNVVVSAVPLARHRADHVSNHLISEPFDIHPETFSAVQQAMQEFDRRGATTSPACLDCTQ